MDQPPFQLPGLGLAPHISAPRPASSGLCPPTSEQLAALVATLPNGVAPAPPSSVPTSTPLKPTSMAVSNLAIDARRLRRTVDSDKEDGEISESYTPAPSDPLTDRNTLKRKQTDRGVDKSRKAPRTEPAARQDYYTDTAFPQQSDSSDLGPTAVHQEIMHFITLWHQAGLSFQELSSEVRDPDLLRSMYALAGIAVDPLPPVRGRAAPTQKPVAERMTSPPIDAAAVLPPTPNDPAIALAHAPPTLSTLKIPDQTRTVHDAQHSAVLKTAPPLDRNEYLARLQAARTPRPASATPNNARSSPCSAVTLLPTPLATDATVETKTSTESQPSSANPANATELIRKKMEALKALQRKPNNISDTPNGSEKTAQNSPSMGANSSRIPAALDTGPNVQARGRSLQSNVPALRASTSSPQRLVRTAPTISLSIFNQPRAFGAAASSDEALIIDISDNETDSAVDTPNVVQETVSVPWRPASSRAPSSFPSMTPVLGSSSLIAESEELKRKQKEITQLQERIAQMEKRKASVSVAVSKPQTPKAQQSVAAAMSTMETSNLEPSNLHLTERVQGSSEAPVPPAAPDDQHDRLRLEIQAHDAKMHAKKRRMVDLQAQMAQIQSDFDNENRLQQNLQSQLERYTSVTPAAKLRSPSTIHEQTRQQTSGRDKAQNEQASEIVHEVAVRQTESLQEVRSLDVQQHIDKNEAAKQERIRLMMQAMSPLEQSETNTNSTAHAESPSPTNTKRPSTIQQAGAHETAPSVTDRTAPHTLADTTTADRSMTDGLMDTDHPDDGDTDADMDMSTDSSSDDDSPVRQIEVEYQNGSEKNWSSVPGRESSHVTAESGSVQSGAVLEMPEPEPESDQSMSVSSGRNSIYAPTDPMITRSEGLTPHPETLNMGDGAPELHRENQVSSTGAFIYKTQSRAYFQPYRSPLQAFSQYRFHPEYRKQVAGGFRSRTFSHSININNPMCRFELDGGVCNDPECPFQHFRDIDISDDAILVQMGSKSVNPGQTEAERLEYNSGLMTLIRQLRAEDIQDVEEVATRLAQYRRDFLGDPSRILLLP